MAAIMVGIKNFNVPAAFVWGFRKVKRGGLSMSQKEVFLAQSANLFC
jgi:hypothetical protein